MNRRLLNNIIIATFLAGLQIGALIFIYHNSKKHADELAWQERYNFSIGYALGRAYVHNYLTTDTDVEGAFDHFQSEGAKKYDELKLELEQAKENK